MSNPWNNNNRDNTNFQNNNQQQSNNINIPFDGLNLTPSEIKKYLKYALAALTIVFFLSGFYTVRPDQRALVLFFGKCVSTSGPGIHWNIPILYKVINVSVDRVRQIDVGRDGSEQQDTNILTGDKNIVSIDFSVFWKVKDPKMYAFNVKDQEAVIKTASQSAMRHIISSFKIQDILTDGRSEVQYKVKELLQNIMDSYSSGVQIEEIQLQNARPPEEVSDAFDDVQRAMQDRDRIINEAEAYTNDIIPRAQGEALAIMNEALSYSDKEINLAYAYADRFKSLYEQYLKNPEIVKSKLYNEIVGQIYKDVDKIIINGGSYNNHMLLEKFIANKSNKNQ